MTDDEIIALLFHREEQGVKEISAKYGIKLKQLAFRFLENEQDAEECLNDVYLKAWDAIPPQKPTYLFAYLAKICRYTAFSMIDQKHAQKRNAVLVELTAEMEQCIPDPSANHSQGEITEALNAFLGTLKQEQRMLFVRRYWYGDSIAELAKMRHCQEGRIKTILFRIRKKLEKFLKERGISYE